uniref:ANK_REP_REGION domain-containing protein n=1 Tax=Macrostomum lignano TaxID=282301 RepID=A0A1I8JKV1_9PLAT
MAHKLVARLSSQSHSTDRDFSPSRGDPEDDIFGVEDEGNDNCCCSDSMGDDEADQQASTTETFNLDVFSKEFTDSRVYRSIVQGNLAGLYHAVYCLREPVTVIDTNFGVNYIHLVVTTASRETQFTYAPFVYALSNFRVDICQEDVGGDTPLKLAIRRGLVELVRAVLRCGAPPPDPADSEMQPSLANDTEESATNATAVKTVCEDFQPGLWAAVAAADYFLVDRLVSSWCRVRIAKQGESLISFARRLETGSLIVDLLESSRPTLEFVHATLAGDRRKMLELLDNKNVNADTFDRSYRPNAGAPCQPRSLKAAATELKHYHVLQLLPDPKKGKQQQQLPAAMLELRHRPHHQKYYQHHQQLLQQHRLLGGKGAALAAVAASSAGAAAGGAAASPLAAAAAAAAAVSAGEDHQSPLRRATSAVCRVM